MPDPSTVSAEADRQSFLMRIDDAFAIKGRGTVVTGRVARGTVRAGDEVKIIDSHDKMLKTVVTGVEMLHKVLDQAAAGDNVGILLRGIEVDDVKPDMVLAAAESFTSYAEALLALDAAGSSSEPPAASGGSFLMRIDDVFAIKGRGTVVVGRVARGTTQTGSEVEIFGPQSETRKTIITGIEMLRKTQDQATAGDNVGILLHGIEANEVTPGMIVAQSGSFTSYAEALRELK